MLFRRFVDICKKYGNKRALNDHSYNDLLSIVDSQIYYPICEDTDIHVIIQILAAAKQGKPLVILPKNRNQKIDLPQIKQSGFGLYLYSSGSTGPSKALWLSESMILANADVAVRAQSMTELDNILTVCSLNHTGGLNAQTIPGLLIGSSITVKKFDPYSFGKDTTDHTITHLVPPMMNVLSLLKSFNISSTMRLVVAGSDCIHRSNAELWQKLDVDFMINYGLTQAGPIICNHVIRPHDSLDIFDHGVPLGTKVWCEYKIIDGELCLRGSNVSDDIWFATDDCVSIHDSWLLYRGRKSAGCTIVPKKY